MKNFATKKMRAKKFLKTYFIRIVAAILLIILCCLPPVFLNTAFGYLPLLTLIFTMLLSACYLFVLKNNINYVEHTATDNCTRDTDIDFAITLKNSSPLIFTKVEAVFYVSDLFGNIDSTTTEILTIASKEERQFHFNVNFQHIGQYATGLKQIRIYDPINLFSFTLKNTKTYFITVTPKIVDYHHLSISNQVETESQRSLISTAFDGMDYTGVREYVIGDPIKNIHWKLSSHSNGYLTKQMETYGNSNIAIIMDLISPTYDSETKMCIYDAIIETSISLGKYAKDFGIDYSLIYSNKNNVKQVIPTLSFSNLYELINDLPIITSQSTDANATEYLKDESTSLYGASNVIYCTSSLTPEIIEGLISIKMKRRNAMLFIVVPKRMSELDKENFLRPIHALEEYSIPFYIISKAEDFSYGGNVL